MNTYRPDTEMACTVAPNTEEPMEKNYTTPRTLNEAFGPYAKRVQEQPHGITFAQLFTPRANHELRQKETSPGKLEGFLAWLSGMPK